MIEDQIQDLTNRHKMVSIEEFLLYWALRQGPKAKSHRSSESKSIQEDVEANQKREDRPEPSPSASREFRPVKPDWDQRIRAALIQQDKIDADVGPSTPPEHIIEIGVSRAQALRLELLQTTQRRCRHWEQVFLPLLKLHGSRQTASLDEPKTVDSYARTQVFRPEYQTQGRLHPTIYLVDCSSRLAPLWELYIRDLNAFFSSHLGFKVVNLQVSFRGDGTPQLLRRTASGGQKPVVISEPRERTLVIGFGDLISSSPHELEQLFGLFNHLSRRFLCSIFTPLPERIASVHPLIRQTRKPSRLSVPGRLRWCQEEIDSRGKYPFLLVPFEREIVAAWARFVTAPRRDSRFAALEFTSVPPEAFPSSAPDSPNLPLLKELLDSLSADAIRFAGAASALPELSPSILYRVLDQYFPAFHASILLEFLASGLVERSSEPDQAIRYRFRNLSDYSGDEVRRYLIAKVDWAITQNLDTPFLAGLDEELGDPVDSDSERRVVVRRPDSNSASGQGTRVETIPPSNVLHPDVFISYCPEEIDAAEKLHKALADRGIKVWRDRRTRTNAADADIHELLQALAHAKRIFAILPAHSPRFDLCLEECKIAEERGVLWAFSGDEPVEPFRRFRDATRELRKRLGYEDAGLNCFLEEPELLLAYFRLIDFSLLSYSLPDERHLADVKSFLSTQQETEVLGEVLTIPARGERWPEIERGIPACEALVIIVSRYSLASEWILKIVELARNLGKKIVPIRIDGCDAFPLFEHNDIIDHRIAATSIFLSHSSADDSYVGEFEALIRQLHKEEVTFNDVRSIPAGAGFWSEIEQGIQKCHRFYVIVSHYSMASVWVAKEIELARSLGKQIIGVRIEDCEAALLDGHDIVNLSPALPRRNVSFNTNCLPATYTGKLYGREAEIAQLFNDLRDANTRIVAYDAMGGSGKTALIDHFVHQLKAQGWPALDSVFIWSFYSQGSSEDKQAHAADFFEAAYAHFHPEGKDGLPDAPYDQGIQLAELIAYQRTLLVLDGLEPLQYAAGGYNVHSHHFGGIKDQGVKALLRRLADIGQGLTIVTTRIRIHELSDHSGFQSRVLDQLPTEAAIELLRDRGIEAVTFPQDTHPELPEPVRVEFVRSIEGLRNHALSLNLAAHLVANSYEGQIKAFADVLPHLHDDSRIHENHRSPFRVMRALEVGLYRVLHHRLQRMSAQESIADSPAANQLALLYFLGLFDRPAALDLLPVVYDAPEELRDAVHMQPEDKAEYLRQVEAEAAKRDQVLNDPNASDDDRLAARHRFEDRFYQLSFHYWLPPVFARFDQGPRSVTNALQQLNGQGLVSKARLTTVEGGHAEWESVAVDKGWHQHHVDCHPLIREYFGHQLETQYPEAFRATHGRLYDWFRFAGLREAFRDPVAYGVLAFCGAFPDFKVRFNESISKGTLPEWDVLPPCLRPASSEQLKASATLIDNSDWETALQTFLPADEAGMTPLFAAIGHGCLAGRHDECFNEVYWPRISRGNEKYAVHKLGLYGQDLAALASFFLTRHPETDEPLSPFSTPHPHLQPSDQVLVLNLAGFRLRAIGRLPDAVAPFREYARLTDQEENWKHTAVGHGNLSELLLTLGHLERDEAGEPGALPTAQDAVSYADQSGDLFQRMSKRANADANALLAAGRLGEAEARFREAEELQRERQPQLPRLYSLSGFLYGDLLLARQRPQEVRERVAYSLQLHQQNNLLLPIGLDELNAARAQAHQDAAPSFDFLARILEANSEDHIPRGYLAQAEILLLASAPDRAAIEAALNEAETRAQRGPMPLFLAEAYLLRGQMECRLGGQRAVVGAVTGESNAAQKWLEKAKGLIDQHRYERRRADLAVLQCEIEPSLDNLQIACAQVREEGWWHLMSRLEALAEAQPRLERLLAPLRKEEQAYHSERDEYIKSVEKNADRLPAPDIDQRSLSQDLLEMLPQEGAQQISGHKTGGVTVDQLLAQLPQQVIQQIADQAGAPTDWHQWSAELKNQAAKAVVESQQSER